MKDEIRRKCEEARKKAEEDVGFKIADMFAEEILDLCERKCKLAGEDEEYLPIMYRFELPIKILCYALNDVSERAQKLIKEVKRNVLNMSSDAVSSPVS